MEEPSIKGPIKKGMKSEYVKIKQITPEDKLKAQRHEPKEKASIISPNEIQELKEIFDRLDKEASGFVSTDDLKNIFESQDLSSSSFLSMVKAFEFEGPEILDFDKFIEVLSEGLGEKKEALLLPSPIITKNKARFSQEMVNEMKDFFDCIDSEKSGYIDKESLKALATRNEYESFNSGYNDLLQVMDQSQNNRLDFGGFLEMISESEMSNTELSEFPERVNMMLTFNKGKMKKTSYETYSSHSIAMKTKNNETRGRSEEDKNRHLQHFKEAFDFIDSGQNGVVTCEELDLYANNEFFQNNYESFCEAYRTCEFSGSGKLTFEELLKVFKIRDI